MIKIPASEYGEIDTRENILMSLGRIANNYRFKLDDPKGHLNSLIEEYDQSIREIIKEVNSRNETWKKLLGKYYKMICKNSRNGCRYHSVSYIYPYQVIDANNTLWMLEVKEGDDYEGGVKDRNYTVDRDWNYDTYLEEITEEEFREKAAESTKHVIDRRLSKLAEPKVEYTIITSGNELDK